MLRRPFDEARGLVVVCGLAAAVALAPVAIAQEGAPFDGRGFEGVRLPLATVPGSIGFEGRRAWVWEEPPGSGSAGTRRILIEGHVRAVLGRQAFNAERAVVWMQKLPGAGDRVYQVYALLDGLESLEGDAAVSIRAERLPIEGVISLDEPAWIRTDLTRSGRPTEGDAAALVTSAEALFADQLREIAGGPPVVLPPEERVARGPRELADPETLREMMNPYEQVAAAEEAQAQADRPELRTEPAAPPPEIFTGEGVFYYSAGDRVSVQRGEEHNAVTLTGGVVIQYTEADSGRSLELEAQRAVIFLKPGPLDETLGSFTADSVEGLYLEGGFRASNGSYTVRGPRVYYDVAHDRAIMLDAVFWTYEKRLGMPLYVRAEAVRQEARDQFVASKAEVSNTAFFHPHFSIGTTSVKVTLEEDEATGDSYSVVDARNITLLGGGLPMFWWPVYVGDPERFPLRSVGFTSSNRTGPTIKTGWDLFGLMGMRRPDGLDAQVQVDYYGKRGLGLGTTMGWDTAEHHGGLFSYLLPNDTGVDRVWGGREVDQTGEVRGAIVAEEMWRFREQWTLVAEGTFISDETFIESFDEEASKTRREFTNRLALKWQDEDFAGTIEFKGAIHDFISNEDIIQSPGYLVDKLPEIGVRQAGGDLLGDLAPGLLTHTWEASFSHMRLRFSEETAASYGFTDNASAMAAFGTLANQSLGAAQRGIGLTEDFVNRFDTRHEIAAPLQAGPISIRPFLVGRFTAYDNNFTAFSPNEEDNYRLWGAAGITFSTSIVHVDDSVDSQLFDLHRIRHIIEPSLTLWHGATNVQSVNLPVYDDDVEALMDGSAIRVGLNQTWQTKRGGPGRWRTVDVFKLNAEYVWTSDTDDRLGAIPRFFDARPELSTPGEHARIEAIWNVTDVVALAGESIYDFEINQQARTAGGILFRHTDQFSTSLDMRYINSQNVTYGGASARYRLTNKYDAEARMTYNFQRDEFQTFSLLVNRKFPNLELGVLLRYDNVQGETSFGFQISPLGGGRSGQYLDSSRGIGGY
ncbi:MAG: LPS assembly protein LptD [Phycisphaerales bacterium]